MRRSEIEKLEDKDLQLRYYLGGLRHNMSNDNECIYWRCDIDCGCPKLNDDIDLTGVKDFIKKHNITNERFLRLAYNHLAGNYVYYHNEPSEILVELEEVLKPFLFNKWEKKTDNTLYDKKLEELINDVKNPHAFYVEDIRDFIDKYNLTDNDFITLAKTWINHRWVGLVNHYDSSIDKFADEIKNIINNHGLYIDEDMIEAYIEADKRDDDSSKAILEATIQQRKYLEALKIAYKVNPEETHKLIDLGQIDIKHEILKQDIPTEEPKGRVLARRFKDRFKKDNK